MSLIEFPLGFSGRVFRSPMPFTAYDPFEMLFKQYQEQEVSVVVLLVEDEQCIARTGRNLRLFYHEKGMEVIHLPIPDFGVPSLPALEEAVQSAIDRANQGKNIVVHCYAGLGRTGTFLACLARRAFGMTGDQAVKWVRSYLSPAIETPGQVRVIQEFGRDLD